MRQVYLSAWALLLGVFALSAATHTYFSVSKRGVQVYRNEHVWQCDQIACPANTYMCEVIKTVENKTMLTSRNTCYDKNEQVLVQKQSVKRSKQPQNETIMMEVYRNGVIATSQQQPQQQQQQPNDTPTMEFDISLKQLNVDERSSDDENVEEEVNNIMNFAVKKFIADSTLNS